MLNSLRLCDAPVGFPLSFVRAAGEPALIITAGGLHGWASRHSSSGLHSNPFLSLAIVGPEAAARFSVFLTLVILD